MPRLNQLNCSIELGRTKTKLGEYGLQYGDGRVECYVPIPTSDHTTFGIHLTSDGYIAPGLAMFVYMDGQYQCNRNKCGFLVPGKGVPPEQSSVDFTVRQKEEVQPDGKFLGRDWTFSALQTSSDNRQPQVKSDYLRSLGTIEVVVLRCDGSNNGQDNASEIDTGESRPVQPPIKADLKGSKKQGKSKAVKDASKAPTAPAPANTAPGSKARSSAKASTKQISLPGSGLWYFLDGPADCALDGGNDQHPYNYGPASASSHASSRGSKGHNIHLHIHTHGSAAQVASEDLRQPGDDPYDAPKYGSALGTELRHRKEAFGRQNIPVTESGAGLPEDAAEHLASLKRYQEGLDADHNGMAKTVEALVRAVRRAGLSVPIIEATNRGWDESRSAGGQVDGGRSERQYQISEPHPLMSKRDKNIKYPPSIGKGDKDQKKTKDAAPGGGSVALDCCDAGDDKAKEVSHNKKQSISHAAPAWGDVGNDKARQASHDKKQSHSPAAPGSSKADKAADGKKSKAQSDAVNWPSTTGKKDKPGNNNKIQEVSGEVNYRDYKAANQQAFSAAAELRQPSKTTRSTSKDRQAQPYWTAWNEATKGYNALATPPASNAAFVKSASTAKPPPLRDPYLAPAYDLPTIPEDMVRNRNIQAQVKTGRGAPYAHATGRPAYIDGLEAPFAVFSFKYRSCEVLQGKFPNERIQASAEDVREYVKLMSKVEMQMELLRYKSSMQVGGGGGGGGKASDGWSQLKQEETPAHEKVTNWIGKEASHKSKSQEGANRDGGRGMPDDNNWDSGKLGSKAGMKDGVIVNHWDTDADPKRKEDSQKGMIW